MKTTRSCKRNIISIITMVLFQYSGALYTPSAIRYVCHFTPKALHIFLCDVVKHFPSVYFERIIYSYWHILPICNKYYLSRNIRSVHFHIKLVRTEHKLMNIKILKCQTIA